MLFTSTAKASSSRLVRRPMSASTSTPTAGSAGSGSSGGSRMPKEIRTQRLTREAFGPFGDVIEIEGAHSFPINGCMCTRFHDLAKVETTGENARTLVSLLSGKPYELPLTLAMVERHPLGSQAFVPLSANPFLVVVAEDGPNGPGEPLAFLTA